MAVLLAWPALAGCADGPGGVGAWGFVWLALLAVSVAAYALGAALARAGSNQALRQARADVRDLRRLHDGWLWETDASHRLVSWRGPGSAAQPRCPLFAPDAGDASSPDPEANDARAALAGCLRAEQAFANLRVTAPQAVEGAHVWVLAGAPRHDDSGRFCGYFGSARPADEAEASTATAAALPDLLAALPGPAVWAMATPAGWQIRHFNQAARAKWPALTTGADLDTLADALPDAVRDALPAGGDGKASAADAGGWQLRPCAPLPAGPSALLLTQGPAAGQVGAAATAESDSFSFTVSHDLRAPIRVVEGFTRIVKEDYGRLLDRVGNDHLDRVLGAAARMNLMIDALLTLARLSTQPLARQPVNLSQLAAYVIDDLRRTAPEREIEISIEAGLSAQGDPTLLRLVLENLLGNAWKYSARSPRAQIALRSVAHGSGRALVVRDNGAGFDMRSAERLFGLFQRLHSASEFPGHGVGLASVRRIIRRHGGEIWAEAEPGRGAAFFFTLSA